MREHISREAAWAALRRYNQEAFHLQHALTVEGVMQWYAKELGYGDDAEFWGIVGLLHDIDFERWPEEHCQKAPELVPMFITTLSQTRMKSRFLAADEYISPKKSNSVGAS